MIVTVESTPDTVITLATGAKVVVAETPAEVAAAVQAYRAEVLAEAFRRRGRAADSRLPPPPAPSTASRRATAAPDRRRGRPGVEIPSGAAGGRPESTVRAGRRAQD